MSSVAQTWHSSLIVGSGPNHTLKSQCRVWHKPHTQVSVSGLAQTWHSSLSVGSGPNLTLKFQCRVWPKPDTKVSVSDQDQTWHSSLSVGSGPNHGLKLSFPVKGSRHFSNLIVVGDYINTMQTTFYLTFNLKIAFFELQFYR